MANDLRGRVAQRAAGQPAAPPVESSVTEIAKQEKPLVDLVRQMEPEFRKAAPKGVEAVQVVRDVLTLISTTPALKDCVPLTVLGGAMTMAQLGLRVGVLGHGWLLPFRDNRSGLMKAQLVIGYKGYVELINRSGRVSGVGAHAVHQNDHFLLGFQDGRRVFDHQPDWWGDRGPLLGWYAAAQEKGFDTWTVTDPWSVPQMEQHRDRFAMAKKGGQVVGPWRDNFEAMAKKTMVLRLAAMLPKSTEVEHAIEADNTIRVDLAPEGIERGERVIEGEAVEDTFEQPAAAPDAGGETQ